MLVPNTVPTVAVDQEYKQTQTDKFLSSMFDRLGEDVSYLKGRILTIIDATTEDKQKREAVKDLVEQAYRDYWDRHYSLNSEINGHIKRAMGEEPWPDSMNGQPNMLPPLVK